MSGFVGVVVSDPSLQGQFTQVELQSLEAKFVSLKRDHSGHITTKNLPGLLKKLRGLNGVVSEDEIATFLSESYPGSDQEIDFESFLREYLNLQARVSAKEGGGGGGKTLLSFLKSRTTTLLHNLNQAEKSSYVAHINTYLRGDPFLKDYLPIDPAGNQLFDRIRDGVLLCKLINVAVPGTIDERAINKKKVLNPWERNENHTLCLNSANAIGCTVVNIGPQDLEEGRPHLVLGLLSQIIKIQLSAKTPQLVELPDDSKDIDKSINKGNTLFDSCEGKMGNGDSQEVDGSNEMMGDGDFGSEGDTLVDSCEGKMGNGDSEEVDGSNEMMGDGDFGSEGNTLFDSCEGKMGNADSQEVNGSNEMMGDGDFGSEDVGYSDFGSEDLGDSDSAIYSGGDPSSCEEMDDDDEEMEDDNFEPFYYYGQAGVPNSSFEEKRPEAKHTNGNLDILDDDYELQVERGIVTRWACVNYSSLAYKRSQRLLFKIRNMCVAIGMEFAVLPLKELGVSAGKDDIQQLLDADKIELLLLIPPFYGCDDGVEENIEKMCKVAEVAYQRCFPYLSQLDLKKLARQIQSKVVKHHVRRRRQNLPLVSEDPTIIFGADMLHCAPGEDSESIASVVASLDWPKFRRYRGFISYQPHNEGIIKDLSPSPGGALTLFLKSFYRIIKKRPKRLIFFRGGLNRGEFGYICQQEIDAIKRACASDAEGYTPLLTYVVVLPLQVWNGLSKNSEHIHPGTGGDPTKFKFMCRHTTKEISSVMSYRVVHDDNNFPPCELQSLTSRLCSFRHRRENPRIDTVVPAYLACKWVVEEFREMEEH